MDIFNANDFREFVNNNVDDQDIVEEVATLTNKHLEEIIAVYIDKEALSQLARKTFQDTVNGMKQQRQFLFSHRCRSDDITFLLLVY